MLYHILARFNLHFINLLHIIILVALEAWHINSKMNQPPNYREMGFSFPSLHIDKNLPRITVSRELKCPDTSIVVVTLALLPMVNSVCPRARTFLCVTAFPRPKLPLGYFHGYIKKNKRTSHDSSWTEKFGLSAPWGGLTNHKAECS